MPLPFLIVPALSYVASSIVAVTGYSGAAVVGAGVGGASAGGLGVWFFGPRDSNAQPLPEEHVERLEEQQGLINNCFDEAEENRAAHAETVVASLKKSTTSLQTEPETSKNLQKTSETLSSGINKLTEVCATAASTAQSFSKMLPALEKSSSATHKDAEQTALEFLAMKDELMKMKAEMKAKMKAKMKAEEEAHFQGMAEKDKAMVGLIDKFEALTEENEGNKKALARALHRNSLFRAKENSRLAQDGGLIDNQSPAILP